MKMMKFGIVAAVCGLILAGTGATHAQGKRAALRGNTLKQAGVKHEGALAKMLAQLNLTPDQKKQIAVIAAGAKKQGMSIKQNASLSATDKKAQEKTLGKETRKQIVAVLTSAQKQQLKQLIAQRKAAKTGSATPTPGAVSPATPASPKTGGVTPPGNGSVATGSKKTDDDDDDDDLNSLDEIA